MIVTSKNLKETEQCADTFIRVLKSHEKQATIVALYGDLGSGKTTFTQYVAKKLGVTDTVTSPTFVIEKMYKLSHPLFSQLIHIDAYRLESSTELLNLNWQEIISDPKNLIMLEWPERVADILPDNMQKIYFTFTDETTREIKL
jgi:tRNA threonylcarbamoyladenosine biosynthesis protein TsaE